MLRGTINVRNRIKSDKERLEEVRSSSLQLGVVFLLFLSLYKVKNKEKTFLPLLFLETIENNKKMTPDTKKLFKTDIPKK